MSVSRLDLVRRPKWRWALACSCSALALLGVAASVSARIVVGKGIGGIKLGDNASAVRHLLGAPTTRRTCQKFTGMWPCGPKIQFWSYTSRKLDILLLNGRVAMLGSQSTAERTQSGIGPGVDISLAMKRYPHGAVGKVGGIHGYYLPKVPTRTGDVFTVVITNGGSGLKSGLKGKIADLEVGRRDTPHACDFFACQ